MSSINGAGELGIYVRSLRDRAATVRRLARDINNEEAVRSLHKHAEELEQKATELESKISAL